MDSGGGGVAELTVSFWQVGRLVAVGSVLGGVAVSSGVLPSGPLDPALLVG